jgi:glycosyltransferase A (GT-A) superfamily protein (DUF2064 family)
VSSVPHSPAAGRGSGPATLAVIAKEPRPGRVKTRLIGPVTPHGAARLAAAALQDTLTTLSAVPVETRVIVLDGAAGPWLPVGWSVVPQSAGGLDERLAAGFDAFGSAPALLVGMDTPQLTGDHLACDFGRYDACLGLAADGGFWAIGFADPRQARATLIGVAMSQVDTGAVQLRRLREAGLRVKQLPVLTDVDTAATAAEVADLRPESEFGRAWIALTAKSNLIELDRRVERAEPAERAG